MQNGEVVILHISDIHRSKTKPPARDAELLSQLIDDIRNGYPRDNRYLSGTAPLLPAPEEIDLLVLSGDLTQRADPEEFVKVENFLDQLLQVLPTIDKDRVVMVPGNHDICWIHSRGAYEEVSPPSPELMTKAGQQESDYRLDLSSWPPRFWRRLDSTVAAQHYRRRMLAFHTFWSRFYGDKYPIDPDKREAQYAIFDTFAEELRLVVVGFSSCDLNDHLWRRGWINPNAILAAAEELDNRGWKRDEVTRVAVWHHNVYGNPDSPDFMDANVTRLLAEFGFSIGLHGHLHESVAFRPAVTRRELTVLGAGSLAAEREERPEGVPLQYNVLRLNLQRGTGSVHIRGRSNQFEPWHAHHRYGPNRNQCWVPIEIPNQRQSERDLRFYTSVENSDFFSELDQMIKSSREIVCIGTGLNALTHNIRTLLLERARAGQLSATICFGNPYSPHVQTRLIEEERADVLPDVAAAGILGRAKSLVRQTQGIENVRIKFFNNYPTLAIFKFDDVYYTYPMGYRTLGNHCPVMRVPAGHPYASFLSDSIQKYLEDAVDADELLRVRELRAGNLNFLRADQIYQFAVYVFPDPNTRFYQVGSDLLGGDIFDQSGSDLPIDDKDVQFFRRYSQTARQYGFHVTVVDVMYVEKSQLETLICETTEIAKRVKNFALTIEGFSEDEFWETDLALHCTDYSGNLELLHSELVARLLPQSLGTNYTLNPSLQAKTRLKSNRDKLMMQKFFTPYILQKYRPHFTLASHFDASAEDRHRLRVIASQRFQSRVIGEEIEISRLHIIFRPFGSDQWQLMPINLKEEKM